MCELTWQKSSFSASANACVEVAAAPDGALRLRESDAPDTVLTVERAAFGRLVDMLKRLDHGDVDFASRPSADR